MSEARVHTCLVCQSCGAKLPIVLLNPDGKGLDLYHKANLVGWVGVLGEQGQVGIFCSEKCRAINPVSV